MIAQLTGRVLDVADTTATIEVGAIAYEVMVPGAVVNDLRKLHGNDVKLFTHFYLDGSLATGNLVPRIVGFLSEADRAFFNLITKVKGISAKKALKAMCVPCHQIAAAIHQGDERSLQALPEIGKRTASLIITELTGKIDAFLSPHAAPLPEAELSEPQLVAVDILVNWGDRRADAQRWVAAAVEADPSLGVAEDIVRAAYRAKRSE